MPTPWKCECVIAMLTLKHTTNSSKIRKIAVISYYCPPGVKRKKVLYDHFSDIFHFLSSKHDKIYFCFAGDSNSLSLQPILSLSKEFKQVVTQPTRGDNILDTICTNFDSFFQLPRCIDPLDADKDKFGCPSDHRMVIYKPLDQFNSFVPRDKKTITYRPWTDSGFINMQNELNESNWELILNSPDVNTKLLSFHEHVYDIYQASFPSKTRLITSENQPFFTDFLSKLKRKTSREYHKHRMSQK